MISYRGVGSGSLSPSSNKTLGLMTPQGSHAPQEPEDAVLLESSTGPGLAGAAAHSPPASRAGDYFRLHLPPGISAGIPNRGRFCSTVPATAQRQLLRLPLVADWRASQRTGVGVLPHGSYDRRGMVNLSPPSEA